MKRFHLAWLFVAVSAVLLLIAGRVMHVAQDADAVGVIYRMDTRSVWLSAASAMVASAAVVLIATSKVGWLRLFAIFPVIVAAILWIATYLMATGRVVVGDQSLVVPLRGLSAAHAVVDFAHLRGVMILREADEVHFVQSDDSVVQIPRGDLLKASLPHIVRVLESREIPVVELD